jgi:hypothetical protein
MRLEEERYVLGEEHGLVEIDHSFSQEPSVILPDEGVPASPGKKIGLSVHPIPVHQKPGAHLGRGAVEVSHSNVRDEVGYS